MENLKIAIKLEVNNKNKALAMDIPKTALLANSKNLGMNSHHGKFETYPTEANKKRGCNGPLNGLLSLEILKSLLILSNTSYI